MRIFPNCETAIDESVREVFSRGMIAFDPTVQGVIVDEAEFSAKELIGYTYSILDWEDKDELIKWAQEHFPHYDGTLKWAEAWFQDRISGEPLNPEPSCQLRRAMWDQYLDPSTGKFSYTYPERMYWQLPTIVLNMKKNRYMRGAMLSIWEPVPDLKNMGRARVPCSISYHFMIRNEGGEDKMTVIYYIRSQDLVNHFPSDIYCALRLGEWMCEQVGDVLPGRFVSYVDSLHAYRRDVASERQW